MQPNQIAASSEKKILRPTLLHTNPAISYLRECARILSGTASPILSWLIFNTAAVQTSICHSTPLCSWLSVPFGEDTELLLWLIGFCTPGFTSSLACSVSSSVHSGLLYLLCSLCGTFLPQLYPWLLHSYLRSFSMKQLFSPSVHFPSFPSHSFLQASLYI